MGSEGGALDGSTVIVGEGDAIVCTATHDDDAVDLELSLDDGDAMAPNGGGFDMTVTVRNVGGRDVDLDEPSAADILDQLQPTTVTALIADPGAGRPLRWSMTLCLLDDEGRCDRARPYQELGAGVIDVKGFHPETPEEVADRIREVLKVWPADKLYVNPDCGFGWSPRYMCNGKIRALAAGARLIRKELGAG